MFPGFQLLAGFHDIEQDHFGPFVWSQGQFRLRALRPTQFATLQLCYYGQQGTLAIRRASGEPLDEIELIAGWQPCHLRIPAVEGEELVFEISPLIPVAGDTRALGLMLRSIELFDGQRAYDVLTKADRNVRLNEREYLQGATLLRSFPPQVRVSMEVRCNLPETSQACVYCAWDNAKMAESGSPPFTFQTLHDLGNFYDCATEVVDCSIGEPTMKKDFGRIVEQMDRDGKLMSLTTNGQLLGSKRRGEILGKNLIIYLSIDSATAAGYARYRNDRFDDIIDNLRVLCRDKKQHGDLPRVFIIFLVMRSNIRELPEFLDLMKEIGVDEVKLRSLNLASEAYPPLVMNNGYPFRYVEEVLTREELRALAPVARRLAEERGLALSNETEPLAVEASSLAEAPAENATSRSVEAVAPAAATIGTGPPICAEPWKTLYFLRSGIFPCRYGVDTLATWNQQGDRSLNQFLGDVFNSETMQSIRSELAQGRLAPYCRNTPGCPILKRMVLEGQIDDVVPPPALAAWRDARLPLVALDALRATVHTVDT